MVGSFGLWPWGRCQTRLDCFAIAGAYGRTIAVYDWSGSGIGDAGRVEDDRVALALSKTALLCFTLSKVGYLDAGL